jgi:redox-sensitive bicupin YhaK (pirin superfamily)
MIKIRKSEDRGRFDHGWLDTRHTFSFGDYQDPEQTGFRALRVMNEDRVRPGEGFGTHGHRDMEIVSYVLEGALEHRDSMGNGSVLRRGMFQRMSAGTGVLHSEFNHSSSEPVHFYQIWLLPERAGIEPGYEDKQFSNGEKRNRLRLVAAADGRDGALRVHQDAEIYLAEIADGREVRHALAEGRHAWVQVLRGAVTLNDVALKAGDGAAVSDETDLRIAAESEAEVMLFDLA